MAKSFPPFLPLSILLSSFFLLSATPHEYHVSVTHMEYNSSAKMFEVSIRFFTDDLEKCLSQNNGNKRFIIKNDDQNSPLIESYVLRNFVLNTPDKKIIPARFLGKEEEQDGTWVYLEIPYKSDLDGCKLQNTALFDTFSDQVNMTNVKILSEKKTFLFKKTQPVHNF